MDKKNIDFGETIRTLRVSRNMTRAELSEAAGISESHLNKIEAGLRRLGINTYQKIMDILDVPIVFWDKGDVKGRCIASAQEIILHCSEDFCGISGRNVMG